MRSKVEIISDITNIVNNSDVSNEAMVPAVLTGILVALLDIRDILENRLQDIAEPIKHIANNDGGNF